MENGCGCPHGFGLEFVSRGGSHLLLVRPSQSSGEPSRRSPLFFIIIGSIMMLVDSKEPSREIVESKAAILLDLDGTSNSNMLSIRRVGDKELTLSYMCEKDPPPAKGKGIKLESSSCSAADADGDEDHRHRSWVERDFLQLGGGGGGILAMGGGDKKEVHCVNKRRDMMTPEEVVAAGQQYHVVYDDNNHYRVKKAKTENVVIPFLAPPPPALALSLNPPRYLPSASARRTKSNNNNNDNTRATSHHDDDEEEDDDDHDDFTASLSWHSCSHPFSHNPSCSLTMMNSNGNFDSSKETDTIWYAAGGGEGTNGSVHSKFRPIGDGNHANISFSNHGSCLRMREDDHHNHNNHHHPYLFSNGICRATGTDNTASFFPSLLPVRSAKDLGKARSEGGRSIAIIRPEHILRDILSESVTTVAHMLKELPNDAIEAAKDYLRSLINDPNKMDEFAKLQHRLGRRSDLTSEALLKANENQLDILVATKTGILNFLTQKIRHPTCELIEIFLLMRCRNGMCNSMLPVEDCDCKICSTTKGFCSACMCPICMKFDCAQSTCTWVGCDVCSHWCHALCGIQKNLIRPGPSLKGVAGTTEVLFYCLGCGHASEMFGFAKDVFLSCAKDWDLETLKRELDCITKIFQGSDDLKGKQLHSMTEWALSLLKKELISPGDACNAMNEFLTYGKSELSTPNGAFKDALAAAAPSLASIPSKPVCANTSPLREVPSQRELLSLGQKSTGTVFLSSLPNMEGFESLDKMVQFKQAEAALFQRLADEARREVEGYRQMIHVETQKLEEEYASKLANICFKETEERRSQKQEELKLLEGSRNDYYKMKKRMEAEMANLLERMEMTKQQLVSI